MTGIVYKPYLPTADDYAACDLPVVGAVPVPVTPGFTG